MLLLFSYRKSFPGTEKWQVSAALWMVWLHQSALNQSIMNNKYSAFNNLPRVLGFFKQHRWVECQSFTISLANQPEWVYNISQTLRGKKKQNKTLSHRCTPYFSVCNAYKRSSSDLGQCSHSSSEHRKDTTWQSPPVRDQVSIFPVWYHRIRRALVERTDVKYQEDGTHPQNVTKKKKEPKKKV